jgi:DNA-binding NtrC family response regulator
MPDIADARILIVDDDTAQATSVRDLLLAHQYPAATISDSLSVLKELSRHDYQVLLLDLNMSGLTGPDLVSGEVLRPVHGVTGRGVYLPPDQRTTAGE